jgi:hypothetical protein
MSKERFFRLPVFYGIIFGITILFGSCLDPIDFENITLPAIKVEVSGSISINDVAVMWLVNRTKTVDVTSFTISQTGGGTDGGKGYPKTFVNNPARETNFASYHTPTEVPYRIEISYMDYKDNPYGVPGTKIIESVQFPRAQDYIFYLYRTDAGLIVIDKEQMTQTPDKKDDTDTGVPSSVNAQTFVVMNVTRDQNIDRVEFVKTSNTTYSMANEPRAGNQQMILLATGSYPVRAYYTRNGTQYTTGLRAGSLNTAVVTNDFSGQSFRTNLIYFYKTTNGDYQLSQIWPPIPNDASDENNPEEALTASQGMLKIINGADNNSGVKHGVIQRVKVDASIYPSPDHAGAYMIPGDEAMYILDVGTVNVSFKSTDADDYGMTIPRVIRSKQTTILKYTNGLALPGGMPPDAGQGAGQIRITNNANAVVDGLILYDRNNFSKSMSIPSDGFTPRGPINSRKSGNVNVIGTPEFPLITNALQIIQVLLITPGDEGVIVVEKIASLNGKTVDIVIEADDLDVKTRIGSKVKVVNNTTFPTVITALQVSNKANSSASAAYPLYTASPPSRSASVYVVSAISLPIAADQRYTAMLTVFGNNRFALIEKEFTKTGAADSDDADKLYSTNPDAHIRTVTLTDGDLPPELRESFVPVADITTNPSPLSVISVTESDLDGFSNKTFKTGGVLYLTPHLVFTPANASKQGPAAWTTVGGAVNFVTLSPDGRLEVTGGVSDTTVTVRAVILDAKGTLTDKQAFTKDITVKLNYVNTIRTKQASGISFKTGSASVEQGRSIDLTTLVQGFQPAGANINGVEIKTSDLNWEITGDARGSAISGSTFTAGMPPNTTGSVTVKAVLPSARNGGGPAVSGTASVQITPAASAFVNVTGMHPNHVFSLPFYTQTLDGNTTLTSSEELSLAVTVAPANASVQGPVTWTAAGGSAAGKVEIVNFNRIRVKSLAKDGETVTVRAVIQNAVNNNAPYTAEFVVTLAERNSRPVQAVSLTSSPAAIQVGETVNMAARLNSWQDNAYWYWDSQTGTVSYITKADLIWEITSGQDYGSLNGSAVTGRAPGFIRLKVTLPAVKGNPAPVSAPAFVTVSPQVIHPNSLTLRVIKLNGSDYISQIVLVPASSTYNDEVKRTGHTAGKWAESYVKDPTFKDGFFAMFAGQGLWTITPSKKLDGTNDWADITLPWSDTGWYVFFIEGDKRVRGYVSPGTLDPPRSKNYLFYLNPAYLYNNSELTLLMKNEKAVREGTAGALPVIPIGYDSYNNTASIMKFDGLDKRPRHDLD